MAWEKAGKKAQPIAQKSRKYLMDKPKSFAYPKHKWPLTYPLSQKDGGYGHQSLA
ncbi:hypothetical protein GCM10028808_65260 [Spirosoma migulaei]